MSKLHFITFAGGYAYKQSGMRIRKEAKRLDIFSSVKTYTPRDLPKSITQSLLSLCPRGYGYWLWKPWIILNKLQKVNYGDIVVYTDCGCELHDNPRGWEELFAHINDVDMLAMQYREGEIYPWGNCDILRWTKKDCVEFFSKGIGTDWTKQPQCPSGFFVAKKTKESLKFVEHWLRIMAFRPDLVIDTIGPEDNDQCDQFTEHRHDQSIFTNLILSSGFWGGRIRVLNETIEPSQEYPNPIITASRIRKEQLPPLKTRVIWRIKSVFGEGLYKKLHFWK